LRSTLAEHLAIAEIPNRQAGNSRRDPCPGLRVVQVREPLADDILARFGDVPQHFHDALNVTYKSQQSKPR
jgi:hypothetical protein